MKLGSKTSETHKAKISATQKKRIALMTPEQRQGLQRITVVRWTPVMIDAVARGRNLGWPLQHIADHIGVDTRTITRAEKRGVFINV